MVTGKIGHPGLPVLSRAVAEAPLDQERARIQCRSTGETTAPGVMMTQLHAVKLFVLVNTLNIFCLISAVF